LQLRGRSYRLLGKRELASRDYASAYDVAPDDRHACLLRAEDLSEQGMHDEALEILDALSESEGDWAALHNTRAVCFRHQGELDEAIASFDRALELDATLASAWNNRGLTWFNIGDVDKAIADYDRALETSSHADEREHFHCNRGIALTKAGRFADAIADFERAIELNASFPDFHIRFASVLATCPDASLRDGARAREHAQQACELTRWENPEIVEVLASVCRRTGDSEGAAKYTRLMRELREATQPGRQAEDEGLRSAAP
jgi:tetratricopeptide (TPR) repeat protein